jgi:DNA (cytosine-5)-methyltransferase 1
VSYLLQQDRGEAGEALKLVTDHRYLRLKRRPEADFQKHVRLVDLFSGVGSLTLGVWEAGRRLGIGIRPVAVDVNRYALAVYARNFPGSEVLAQDVATLLDGELNKPPTKTERRFVEYLGRITTLLSGSPCQGFCPLNNYTRGRDERNWLYLRATRLVELARPTHVLLENVRDVVNGEVDVVGMTTDALDKWGYHVDAGAFDLAQIGLPQHRKRHVVVASLKKKVSIARIVEKYSVLRLRNVRWAIAGLEDECPFDMLTTPSEQTPENKSRIRYLFRKRAYNLPNSMRPRCHRGGNHSYKSMYGRLRYDLPAQTITGGFQSPGQGRFVHPSRERTLTSHEACRLQFFPDFFDFSAAPTRTMLSEMIGNAAPMNLSKVFALETLSTSS